MLSVGAEGNNQQATRSKQQAISKVGNKGKRACVCVCVSARVQAREKRKIYVCFEWPSCPVFDCQNLSARLSLVFSFLCDLLFFPLFFFSSLSFSWAYLLFTSSLFFSLTFLLHCCVHLGPYLILFHYKNKTSLHQPGRSSTSKTPTTANNTATPLPSLTTNSNATC